MTKRYLVAFFSGAAMLATPAFAGEVNGSTTNPKDDFAKGVSICIFSGLNDDPTGIDPEANGPPGRTQNYGQDVANYGADPQSFNPGDAGACNAHLSPYRQPGKPE
jgi:hypothetical protein